MSGMLSPEQLEAALREIGRTRYHNNHPFHGLLHSGKLNKGQVQAWALNRYYYQSIIPMKDAAILARSSDSEFRRAWRQRIIDHDGTEDAPDGVPEVEVGYGLVDEAHGWGFATEALSALLVETDAAGVRVRASVEPENAASIRVLAKCGFTELRGSDEDGHLVMARPLPSGG